MSSPFDNGGIIGPAQTYGGSGIWSLQSVIDFKKLPPSGPTFESGVIHAWDPDAGADASGIIADAVGSANMWVRSGLSAVASWDGSLTGYAGSAETLCVDNSDISDFFAVANPTLTFWFYEDPSSPLYGGIAGCSTDPYLQDGGGTTGDFTVGRNGSTSDAQVYTWTGYAAGGSGTDPRTCPTGQWNLWTMRFGAGAWALLGNAAVVMRDNSWVTASLAGKTAPVTIGEVGGYTDHTDDMGSAIVGRFGDVRLWNKSLSSTEIIDLHTAGRQSY
tara:strand:- start:81380 stop:82201 length:822 start_codon:yes stop_codon:yes gene_type:complete